MGILSVTWWPGPEWSGYKFTPGERIGITIVIKSDANSTVTKSTLKIQGNGYSTELSMTVDFVGIEDSSRVYRAFTYWTLPLTPGVTYTLNYEVTDNLGEVAKETTQITASGVYTPPPPTPPAPTEYVLTIAAVLNGTTSPSPGQYKYTEGTMATVTAIPQENYIFDHWNLDAVNIGATNPISITMTADHTLEAIFAYAPAGPPPVAPPVTPPPEEVTPPPTVEIIPAPPSPPTVIPPAPAAPPLPIAPETAGLIVLGAVVVVIVIGVAVWYFTKPS